ncbi:hypothetical protein [Reinekea thalattae]|uniref:Uncharacterized protein n=1 Tax=Reinekea thalattae TaxID=2593301 RepID=A0A5C8ZAT9_9GAMM|nr:hypothetical protein [Reinekea thalattae]TXR54006.1 hypothetical protein FME95_05520 [Reinekea thalattae]
MTWILIPERPVESALLWAVVFIAILYFARQPVRRLVSLVAASLVSLLRSQRLALLNSASQLDVRNTKVLREQGRIHVERQLNHHFHRVKEIVEDDFSGYPLVQKEISQLITRIEEDYHQSAEVPPDGPEWVEAIEAIANLREAQKGNATILKVVEELCHGLKTEQAKAAANYRNSVAVRHKLLHAMMPYWRKLNNTIERVGGSFKNLIIKAAEIDQALERYQSIQSGSDAATRMLYVSSFANFLKSAIILACLLAGAYLNYQFIALPMTVDAAFIEPLSGFSIAQLSSLITVLLEIALGVFLMEALHVTHMLPAFGSLTERKRSALIGMAISMLVVFALTQSGLAFYDSVRHQTAATTAAVVSEGAELAAASSASVGSLIPRAAQMMIVFLMPFILMFIAIPMESLIDSTRVLLGFFAVQLLRFIGFIIKLLTVLVQQLFNLLLAIYDLIIFLPLWFERKIQNKKNTAKAKTKASRQGAQA